MGLDEDLAALDRSELKERWREIVGADPPTLLGRPTMIRILVCELQWKASPENRSAIRRDLQKAVRRVEHTKPQATPGVRLIREWNGKRHVVDVSTDGYVWRGQTWKSLTAIAKEITGTKWSGPRFFGVSG
ncbi:MAG: DUF2924 domain-containing protein [Pseudomonadota bacterium]